MGQVKPGGTLVVEIRQRSFLQFFGALVILRGQPRIAHRADAVAMLDSDLARLYGVTTMRLNEQVARNRERFPEDFAYQLTQQEVATLISQNAISKSGRVALAHGGEGECRDHPHVCAAAAVDATPGELVEQLTRLAETVALHDKHIQAIVEVLQQLMEQPKPPRRRIGFDVAGGASDAE